MTPSMLMRRLFSNRERRSTTAGVLDAGLSSLATFGVGLYAARMLSPGTLGAYALVFAAFNLAAIVPCQLVFIPLEVVTVKQPVPLRLPLLLRTTRLGAVSALIPALAVVAWALVVPGGLQPGVVLALTTTGVLTAFLSPIQDHVRRMLHIAQVSTFAVVMSAIQLLVCGAGIALSVVAHLAPAWVPFGVLAAANLLSCTVGLVLVFLHLGGRRAKSVWHLRKVLRDGSWLLLVGILPAGVNFVISTIVVRLLGTVELGYVEATRICAQPVWVLALGLAATAGPRIVAATHARDQKASRRAVRTFTVLVVALGAAYLLAAGTDWRWNPLAVIVPKAFVVPGLLLETILGQIMIGVAYASRYEMLGAHKERGLAWVEAFGNAIRGSIAGAAQLAGPHVVPWGTIALGVSRYLGCRILMRPYYASGVASCDEGQPSPASDATDAPFPDAGVMLLESEVRD